MGAQIVLGKAGSGNPLPSFDALCAFDAVGRLGGIRRAAQGLQLEHYGSRMLASWLALGMHITGQLPNEARGDHGYRRGSGFAVEILTLTGGGAC